MDAEPRRRGRPVSEASRRAALDAAVEVLDERGVPGFSIDEVARRSGVSKATIYKHWSSGVRLAVAAYGEAVGEAVPVLRTGDVAADLVDQVRRLAAVYGGPRGPVIAQLLAAGVDVREGSDLLRQEFFATRRAETLALVREGVEAGRLRGDVDPELMIDLLFGPIVFRLFSGRSGLDPDEATTSAELAVRALAAPDVSR